MYQRRADRRWQLRAGAVGIRAREMRAGRHATHANQAVRLRSRMLRTVIECQSPPRAVQTPLAVNASAIAASLVAPWSAA